MKTIKIVTTSRGDFSKSLLCQSMASWPDKFGIEVIPVEHNKSGLSKVYNTFLTTENKNSIIVFMHDDILLPFQNFPSLIFKAMENFDVAGVAGGSHLKIENEKLSLWHLMVSSRSGFAGHFSDSGKVFMTSFGETPHPSHVLDGVFLAVNVEKALHSGLSFDEAFEFHHYDLDFTFNAHKKGLKVGVWPIFLFHKSKGLEKITSDFLKSDFIFKKKWMR